MASLQLTWLEMWLLWYVYLLSICMDKIFFDFLNSIIYERTITLWIYIVVLRSLCGFNALMTYMPLTSSIIHYWCLLRWNSKSYLDRKKIKDTMNRLIFSWRHCLFILTLSLEPFFYYFISTYQVCLNNKSHLFGTPFV